MSLRHIKIFVAVCEYGTLTEAGKHLYMAQPAVSLAIAEIEKYYNIKLFDRISKRLYLTTLGKQFLQYATHIVSLYDEMEQSIKDWDFMGTIHIGASITIGNHLLPLYVEQLQHLYPNMKIHVTVENSSIIESLVLNNKIDIGLIEGSLEHDYIKVEPFKEDLLTFICPIHHPLSNKCNIDLTELQGMNFLLREKGSAGRAFFNNIINTYELNVHVIWESASTQALINGVSRGLGLSLLPYLLVQDKLKANEISSFTVKNLPLSRNFSIIYHKNKFLTKSCLDFINLCKNSQGESTPLLIN